MAVFSYGVAMEVVTEEHSRLQLWPAVASGMLRLSSHGLWAGQGTYTSPIIDLGEIYNFSGISWESEELFQTAIDTTVGGVRTFEVRYHDYSAPVYNQAGYPWYDGQLSSPLDSMWGEEGALPWVPYENNDFTVTGVMIRYIQWRAVLRGA